MYNSLFFSITKLQMHFFCHYSTNREQFSGIPYLADIGLIRVNSSTLKALLLPNPEAMITNIRELLPLLMKEDSGQLVLDFTEISEEMVRSQKIREKQKHHCIIISVTLSCVNVFFAMYNYQFHTLSF